MARRIFEWFESGQWIFSVVLRAWCWHQGVVYPPGKDVLNERVFTGSIEYIKRFLYKKAQLKILAGVGNVYNFTRLKVIFGVDTKSTRLSHKRTCEPKCCVKISITA